MFVKLIIANFYTTFALALPTNITLIWLIVKHSPAEMFIYKRILLITCAIDLLLAFGFVVEQPIFFQHDKAFAVIFLGPLCVLPKGRILLTLWTLLTFLFSLNSTQIPMQFLYRYLVLNRSQELPIWAYSMVLCLLSVLINIPYSIVSFDEEYVEDGHDLLNAFNHMLQILGENEQVRIAVAIDANIEIMSKNSLANFGAVLMIIFYVLSYAVVVFCGYRVYKFAKNNYNGPNMAQKREVNRQVTATLLFQALIPLAYVVMFFIMMTVIYGRVLLNGTQLQEEKLSEGSNFSDSSLIVSIFALLSWIPVCNPIITLMTIGKYRRTLMRWFARITF